MRHILPHSFPRTSCSVSYGSATVTFHIAAGLALTWVALWIIAGSNMPLEAPKIVPVDDFSGGTVSENNRTTGKTSVVEEEGLSPSKVESNGIDGDSQLNVRASPSKAVKPSPAAALESRATSRKHQQHATRRCAHQSVNGGGGDVGAVSNWSFPTTAFALPAHPEEEESDLGAQGGYSSPRSRARLDVTGFEGDSPDHERGGGQDDKFCRKGSYTGRTTAPATPPGAAAVGGQIKTTEEQRPQANRSGSNGTTDCRYFRSPETFTSSIPVSPWYVTGSQQPSADGGGVEDGGAAPRFAINSHPEANEDGLQRPFQRSLISNVSFGSGAARDGRNRPKVANVWATSSSGGGGGSRSSNRQHSSTMSSSSSNRPHSSTASSSKSEGEGTASGGKLSVESIESLDRRAPSASTQEVEDGTKVMSGGREPPAFPWRKMLASPAAWAVVAGNVGAGTAINVLMSWLPTYFEELIQVDLSEIGLFAQVTLKRD